MDKSLNAAGRSTSNKKKSIKKKTKKIISLLKTQQKKF